MSLHQGLALNSPSGRTVMFEQTDAACAILSPAPETRVGNGCWVGNSFHVGAVR